jgi:hypothetical protein
MLFGHWKGCGVLLDTTRSTSSFFEFFLDQFRVLAHRQYGNNINTFLIDRVIDGVWKSLGRHSVKTMLMRMNATIKNKRFDITHDTVPKVIPNSWLYAVVELPAFKKVVADIS